MLAAVPLWGFTWFKSFDLEFSWSSFNHSSPAWPVPAPPWYQHQTTQGWALWHSKMDGFVPKQYPGTSQLLKGKGLLFNMDKDVGILQQFKGKWESQTSRDRFGHGKVVGWNVRTEDGKEREMSEFNRICSDMLRKKIKTSCKCSILSPIKWSNVVPGVYVYSALRGLSTVPNLWNLCSFKGIYWLGQWLRI